MTSTSDASAVRFRVRYAETDQMGIVYHANYLVWFEMARTELCRLRGLSYRELEQESGLRLVVAEASCRYHKPARYDDEIVSAARLAHAHPRMLKFGYEVRHAGSGDLLVTGETSHLFVDPAGRPVKVPPRYFELFGIGE